MLADPGAEAGAPAPPPPSAAPTVQGDWLASVCPYLASEDGSYRSAAPEEGHRCISVEPPATLPLAFQERFCLTDQHPRCEMFKFAQEVRADGGVPIPATRLQAAATRPARTGSGAGSSRSVIIAAAGVGGVAILVLLLVLVMGSCSGGSGGAPDDGASPDPQATAGPKATPTPKPKATPTPRAEDTPGPDATADPVSEAGETMILYEFQQGEGWLKVADTFGVTRRRLQKLNPQLDSVAPAKLPGEVIQVPVPADMNLADVEALPGYRGPA